MFRPTDFAVHVASLGLLTWYFMTPAAMLLAASFGFAAQQQLEMVVTLPGGLFLGYMGIRLATRFGAAVRGDHTSFF